MMNTPTTCESIFAQNAPYFHIYTTPPDNALLFVSDKDCKEAVNLIALSVAGCGGKTLAFAIMSNHLHTVVAATRKQAQACIEQLRKRLNGFLKRARKILPPVEFHLVEITDLKQLRNEIVYVIRNPYVARSDVNPFGYPWCSGFLYFNEWLIQFPSGVRATETSLRERRALKHERDDSMNPSFRILDGMIAPASFVDYPLVMSLYENARQFIWWVTRNVEAQTATAARLGEKALLTDEEVYMVTLHCCKKEYNVDTVKLLTIQQKNSLVRTLKYEYGANNKQLSRCSGIPLALIDEMFPRYH